jgi:hypothetical protein
MRSARLARLGEWLLVVALAAYLGYWTGRFRLLDIPLPILTGIGVVTLLAAWAIRARFAARAGSPPSGSPHGPPGSLIAWAFGLAAAALIGAAILDATAAALALPGLAAAGVAAGTVAADRTGHGPTPVGALAAVAVATWIAQDLVFFQTAGLRDLRLDLRAGIFFDHRLSPYLSAPLRFLPTDQTLLPFLYPPPSLPLFVLLAALPDAVSLTVWTAACGGAVVAALRLFGLRWRWTVVLLLWPAIFQGLYVGNVALIAALLFAVGPFVGSTLVIAGLGKLQNAIPALWLVRERRWRDLVVGIAVVAAICLVTLPIVGLESWSRWIAGLAFYEQSTERLPGLYGIAMPEYVPTALWIVVSIATVLVALRPRGREGLARIGLVSVIASPSLYTHGFIVALPAFLSLRSFWFWVAMALTAAVPGPGWWSAVALGAAAWFVGRLRRGPGPTELHPLGQEAAAWPDRDSSAAR